LASGRGGKGLSLLKQGGKEWNSRDGIVGTGRKGEKRNGIVRKVMKGLA
jgi:hypothetical protein